MSLLIEGGQRESPLDLVYSDFAGAIQRALRQVRRRNRETVVRQNRIGGHGHDDDVGSAAVVGVVGDNDDRRRFWEERSVNGIGMRRMSPCSGIVPVLVVIGIVPEAQTAFSCHQQVAESIGGLWDDYDGDIRTSRNRNV